MAHEFSVGEAPTPPTIFVSSTFYDLRSVRQELQAFLTQSGYIPVLFESAAAIPGVPAPTSALRHASQADVSCLIIGSRYGSVADLGLSWTHQEFRTARDLSKPIFVFIQKKTLIAYDLYRTRENKTFWSPDETSLFSLIDEVSTSGSRFPFETLPDLKSALQYQLISYFGYLIRRYASLDSISPKTAGGWNTRGVAESRRGEYGKALLCYREAHRLDSTRMDPITNLIRCLLYLGRPVEAEQEARRGVIAHPARIEMRTLLCRSLRDQDRIDEAQKEAEECTRLWPEDELSWSVLANVFWSKKDFARAIEAQEKAIAISPTPKAGRRLAMYRAYRSRDSAELETLMEDDSP